MLEPVLATLKPLTPWQLLALAALIHALISGLWLGFLAFCLTDNRTSPWSVDITTPDPNNNDIHFTIRAGAETNHHE